jgi:hypothetical protein
MTKGGMGMSSDILEAVLSRSTPELESWLEGVSIGGPVEGAPFNWQLLAFSMASRATNERDPRQARIALLVYETLARQEGEPASFSLMYSAMNLRAWMIHELGPRKGHAVLDPEAIANWFQRIATFPIGEARRLLEERELSAIPVDELRRLRKIKSSLGALALIADSGITQVHPELEEWLQLRERLP